MKFHASAAAGLKSGQFDQKRNFKKANVEYRIMNIECRRTVFYLFFILKRAERSLRLVGAVAPTPRRAIPQFVNRHSSFYEVSHEEIAYGAA
jgi:hypothetical protein